MHKTSSRERALSARTLICLLQTLIDEQACIELRDDCTVDGTVVNVDAFMNVELRDVILKKPRHVLSDEFDEQTFDYFFVKGTRVRYVHLPDHIDPIKAIERKVREFRRHREARAEATRATRHKAVRSETHEQNVTNQGETSSNAPN